MTAPIGYTGYGGYGSPTDQAMRLAQAELQEGSSYSPIQSKWQGAARLAQALNGALDMRRIQSGYADSNKAALALAGALAGQGGGGLMGSGGGGLPAQPGALSDLIGATGDTPNLTNADFRGLTDADIVGPANAMGPPQAPMAPNNSAGGISPGGPNPGSILPPNMQVPTSPGGTGHATMTAGLPPQGVQVASNDPNFVPQSFSQPSPANGGPNGSNGGGSPQLSPEEIAMFQGDMQGVPGGGTSPSMGGAAPQGGGGRVSLAQAYQLALNSGFKPGDEAAHAAAIAMGESSGNPNAFNGNGGKSQDYGLMQINSVHPDLNPQATMGDPQASMDAAYKLYKESGNSFHPWVSTWGQNGAYNAALPQAERLAGLNPGQAAFLRNSVAGPGAPSNANFGQTLQQDEQGGGSPGPQGGPQGGGIPPQMMQSIQAILMNPYAAPEARQMAMQFVEAYGMPHPMTYQAVPGTNDERQLDWLGRPTGQVLHGGPKIENLAPGNTLIGMDSSGGGAHPIAGWGAQNGQGSPQGGIGGGGGASASQSYQPLPGEDYNAYKARMEASGRNQGQLANPTTEDYAKITQGARGDESYKEADLSTNAYNGMVRASQLDTHASDKTLIDSFNQIMNPNTRNGVGMFQINSDLQSFPDEIRGEVMKAWNGQGKLSPQTRAAMLQDARIRIEAYRSSWNAARSGWLATARHGNVDASAVPDLIQPMDPDWGSISRYTLDGNGNLIDRRAGGGQGGMVPHQTLQTEPGVPIPPNTVQPPGQPHIGGSPSGPTLGQQPTAVQPPMAGAKQASDGKWYVQTAPGKWSRVDP